MTPGGPQPEPDGPATFAELGSIANGGPVCRACGEPATHRLSVTARESKAGKPPGGRTINVATHAQNYCERHAAQLFDRIRKAMR